MQAPGLPIPEAALIAKGRELFFDETFGGNGRTCGTCHRADQQHHPEAGVHRDPAARPTPSSSPSSTPTLAQNFENPRLMRPFSLILENLDGFDDLANKFTMRGIPHVLGLRTSVASPAGPRTGWSGDGAPGDGTLRSFATGAVIQHFTKTLNRVAGVDFRLPTDDELDALEAFQLTLGRQAGPRAAAPAQRRGARARPGDLPRQHSRQVQHLPLQRRRQRQSRASGPAPAT